MVATEQYFPVVLFVMLYKVVLTFESASEILKCDHSSESYWAVLFLWCCLVVLYKVAIAFESVAELLNAYLSNWVNPNEQFFPVVLFILL